MPCFESEFMKGEKRGKNKEQLLSGYYMFRTVLDMLYIFLWPYMKAGFCVTTL